MDSTVEYLLSLEAVRDRANIVYERAQRNDLNHFNFHPEAMDKTADYVASLIKVCHDFPFS
jgi:hypothetical protein